MAVEEKTNTILMTKKEATAAWASGFQSVDTTPQITNRDSELLKADTGELFSDLSVAMSIRIAERSVEDQYTAEDIDYRFFAEIPDRTYTSRTVIGIASQGKDPINPKATVYYLIQDGENLRASLRVQRKAMGSMTIDIVKTGPSHGILQIGDELSRAQTRFLETREELATQEFELAFLRGEPLFVDGQPSTAVDERIKDEFPLWGTAKSDEDSASAQGETN